MVNPSPLPVERLLSSGWPWPEPVTVTGTIETVEFFWIPVSMMDGLAPSRIYCVRFADGATRSGEWHPFWKAWLDPETDEIFDPAPTHWREVGA